MINPYSLMFGKEPFQIIPRNAIVDEVMASFIKKGLITGDKRGYVRLTLPRFDQYCKAVYEL